MSSCTVTKFKGRESSERAVCLGAMAGYGKRGLVVWYLSNISLPGPWNNLTTERGGGGGWLGGMDPLLLRFYDLAHQPGGGGQQAKLSARRVINKCTHVAPHERRPILHHPHILRPAVLKRIPQKAL